MADKFLYVVFGTPASPAADGEFNEWYNDQHIPDVLALPGVVSAQRYKVRQLDREAGKPAKFGYMTVYEIEGDPNEVMDKIGPALPRATS